MLSALLEAKHAELEPHFKAGFLPIDAVIFQFEFDRQEAFHLSIKGSLFKLLAGRHSAPTLTCYISDHATCWGLLDGSIDGMAAFMAGIYRADGNIVLSQLLLYLFKHNDPTFVYEVKY